MFCSIWWPTKTSTRMFEMLIHLQFFIRVSEMSVYVLCPAMNMLYSHRTHSVPRVDSELTNTLTRIKWILKVNDTSDAIPASQIHCSTVTSQLSWNLNIRRFGFLPSNFPWHSSTLSCNEKWQLISMKVRNAWYDLDQTFWFVYLSVSLMKYCYINQKSNSKR